MAAIDAVVATYKGLASETQTPFIAMLQQSNCFCGTHKPWQCNKGKHSVRQMPMIYGSSVVHWSRNQAVAMALYGQPDDGRPPAEYFLLMDDDMIPEPGYLCRLASYKQDIVAGICTVRKDPPMPNIRFWKPEEHRFVAPWKWEFDSQKLFEIDAAGAAFMLVKRRVFETMGSAYRGCFFERQVDERKVSPLPEAVTEYWNRKSELRQQRFKEAVAKGDWKAADCWWFQFLDDFDDVTTGELGEDLSFCAKAKRLGFKIFADPQVLPGHLGTYGYSIRDYREYVKQAEEVGQGPEEEVSNEAMLAVA